MYLGWGFLVIGALTTTVEANHAGLFFGRGQRTLELVATGGVVSEIPGYRVHTFLNDDNFEIISLPPGAVVEYLVIGGGVGGGGGSGANVNGGGDGGSGIVIIRYPYI